MTSNFATAMASIANTWNGAMSLSTPDMSGKTSGRMTLFFKSVRGLEPNSLFQYISETAAESITDAFLLVFHIRDCRGGKGERELGRLGMVWLFLNYPVEFSRVVPLMAEYGRWDDILQLFPGVLNLTDLTNVRVTYASNVESETSLAILRDLQKSFISIMTNKIVADRALMEAGEPVSLCAKWIPTEKGSLDRKTGVYKHICNNMGIKPKALRTKYQVPLRAYINIVERYMCSHRWDEIEFSKVPSSAMRRLKNAFEVHAPTAFNAWKDALQRGEVKVNAKQLQPHELTREIRTKGAADAVCEAQWKVMEDEVKKLGTLENAVVVVDTSGSMSCNDYLPMDVAVALGLIISNTVEGIFHNHVITFHTNPTFVVVKDGSLYNRWRQISTIPWGGSTDIQATFNLVLKQARRANLPESEMPKKMFIISDMQFNQTDRNAKTNFQAIDAKYKQAGYTRPQIIFWNVAGSTTDFPVSVDDSGTALVSGFSPSIMKSILNGKDFSPYSILRDTIDDKRYDPIRAALDPDSVNVVDIPTVHGTSD